MFAEPVARALDVDDDRVMEQAGVGGGDAEGDGEMALAGAGRAEEMHHLGAVVESSWLRATMRFPVQRRLEGGVEALDHLRRVQPGGLERDADAAVLADVELLCEQRVDGIEGGADAPRSSRWTMSWRVSRARSIFRPTRLAWMRSSSPLSAALQSRRDAGRRRRRRPGAAAMVDAGRPVPAAGRSGGSGQAGAGSSPRGRDARRSGRRPRRCALGRVGSALRRGARRGASTPGPAAGNAPPIPARLQVPRRVPLFPG